jgi:hypothetical protein
MSAVFVGMMLGSFSRVMGSVLSVAMRYVSVVTRLLMIPTLMMLGSFTMVFRCVLVMFSRLVMMLCTFVCHFVYLSMTSFAGQSSLQQSQYYSSRSPSLYSFAHFGLRDIARPISVGR